MKCEWNCYLISYLIEQNFSNFKNLFFMSVVKYFYIIYGHISSYLKIKVFSLYIHNVIAFPLPPSIFRELGGKFLIFLIFPFLGKIKFEGEIWNNFYELIQSFVRQWSLFVIMQSIIYFWYDLNEKLFQFNVLFSLCLKVSPNEQLIVDQRGQDSVIHWSYTLLNHNFRYFLFESK